MLLPRVPGFYAMPKYGPSPFSCHCLSIQNVETSLSPVSMIISALVVLCSFCASLATQDSLVRMGIPCLESFTPCHHPAGSLCCCKGSELFGHYPIAIFSFPQLLSGYPASTEKQTLLPFYLL